MKIKSINISIFISITLHLIVIIVLFYYQNTLKKDDIILQSADISLSITFTESLTTTNKNTMYEKISMINTQNVDEKLGQNKNHEYNSTKTDTNANSEVKETNKNDTVSKNDSDYTTNQIFSNNNNNETSSSPLVLNSEIFTYPYEAKKHNIQGEVLIRIYFGDDGKASKVKLLKTSGFSFLDAYTVKKAFKLVLKSYNELVREYLDVLVIYRLKGAAVISYQ